MITKRYIYLSFAFFFFILATANLPASAVQISIPPDPTPTTTYPPFSLTQLSTNLATIRTFTQNSYLDLLSAITQKTAFEDTLPEGLHPELTDLSSVLLALNGLTVINGISTLSLMNLTKTYFRSTFYLLEIGVQREEVQQAEAGILGSLLSGIALEDYHHTQKLWSEASRFVEKAKSSDRSREPVELQTDDILEFGYFEALRRRRFQEVNSSAQLNDTIPYAKLQQILRQISTTVRPKGLFLTKIIFEDRTEAVLALPASRFFSTLIKEYIASSLTNELTFNLYIEAIDAMESVGMISRNDQNGHTFVQSYDNQTDSLDRMMPSDGCGLGAMFALGAWAMNETMMNANGTMKQEQKELMMQQAKKHINWAVQLTETCHSIANQSGSGLFPDKVMFHENGTIETIDETFHDHADLAESYFVLWRLTKDPRYQHYAWELFQALTQKYESMSAIVEEKHQENIERFEDLEILVELGGGHPSELKQLKALYYRRSTNIQELQRIFVKQYYNLNRKEEDLPIKWFGSTLKYLYLTFAPVNLLPLDQWVFSVYGQPIPVYGKI